MKTIPKILQTFFTDTLETHQFAAVEFTLNQRLSTKVNCSCLDKAQNLPVEKIINVDFFSFGFRHGVSILRLLVVSKDQSVEAMFYRDPVRPLSASRLSSQLLQNSILSYRI